MDNKKENESRKKPQLPEQQQTYKSIPALRHVGPTLESDPKYLETTIAEGQTPEKLIEQGIGIDDSNVRDIVSRGTDSEVRTRQEAALRSDVPLKTRLPGDTSSDPHTDVGPDNATDLQRKPDIGPQCRIIVCGASSLLPFRPTALVVPPKNTLSPGKHERVGTEIVVGQRSRTTS